MSRIRANFESTTGRPSLIRIWKQAGTLFDRLMLGERTTLLTDREQYGPSRIAQPTSGRGLESAEYYPSCGPRPFH